MTLRTILTYHSIDGSGSHISVAPEAFAKQISWLVALRVPLLGISDLLRGGRSGVAISFDDGFESVIRNAVPVLECRDIPATIFPIMGALGRKIRWSDQTGALPSMPLMSQQAVGELHQRGWEIGSHSIDHRCLVDLDVDHLCYALHESRDRLGAMTGAAVVGLAYPNGCTNPQVENAVRSAGYEWAVTTVPGQVNTARRYQIRRVNVGPTTTPARFAAAFLSPIQVARRLTGTGASRWSGHTHPDAVRTSEFQ